MRSLAWLLVAVGLVGVCYEVLQARPEIVVLALSIALWVTGAAWLLDDVHDEIERDLREEKR